MTSTSSKIHFTSKVRLNPYICFVLSLLYTLVLTSCSNDVSELEQDSVGMDFFHGTFEQALGQAVTEKKLVFVDVYTTWCGPCIVMQDTVFKEAEVGEFFNARFVNFKLDAENTDQNGPEIAATYSIRVYPTYLILDSDGNELARASSSMTGEQFITMVSQLIGETESAFEQLQSRYDNGDRSQEFLQQYLMDAIVHFSKKKYPGADFAEAKPYWTEQQRYSAVARDYFSSRPYTDLINPTDAHLVLYYKDKSPRGDELVEFVLDNFDEFVAVSSLAAMSQFTLNASWYGAVIEANLGDESYRSYFDAFDNEPLSLVAEYEQTRDPNSRLLPSVMRKTIDLIYYRSTNQWDKIFDHYTELLSGKFTDANAQQFGAAASNLIASPVEEHCLFAFESVQKAFSMNSKDPIIALTYVEVLRHFNRMDEVQEFVNTYTEGLSDSAEDQERQEIFERVVGNFLRPPDTHGHSH